jgi:hypothetical protein
MKLEEYREVFDKEMAIVEVLKTMDPEAYCSVELGSGSNRICFFLSDKTKEEVTRFALRRFGKLSKDKNGNLSGLANGIALDLLVC